MVSRELSILIVEDEYLIASGIAFCVQELGHKLLGIATTGMEAIEMVSQSTPDIMLVDINLPGLDGIETMSIIHEQHQIPCIYVTSYSDGGLIARAQSPYTFGYLIKPVDIHDLRAAINIAISRFEDYSRVNATLGKAKKALEERKIIERAKGIVMTLFDMKEYQALQYLQKKSRDTNTKLVDVARKIIEIDKKG